MINNYYRIGIVLVIFYFFFFRFFTPQLLSALNTTIIMTYAARRIDIEIYNYINTHLPCLFTPGQR